MWRCPVCEKEHAQGSVCDSCGFDSSCDYERNRTLCSALPKRVEPVSVRAAKWRQQQKQRPAVPPGKHLVCPKCGGTQFFFLVDDMQFMCADCETKVPITASKDGAVSENVIASGEAGLSVTWTLNNTGTLTISGSGIMYEYMPYRAPWNDHREKITSVAVKPGVTQIGNSAFGWCTSLTSITLPESVTQIGSNAFWGCSSLTSITLPESVTQIGWRAFNGCTSLTDVYYSGTKEQWRSIQIRFYNDDLLNATIHFREAGRTATPEPENVTASDEAGPSVTWTLSDTGVLTISGSGEMYDFFDDTPWEGHKNKITSVVVEPGVTEIGDQAFRKCTSLTSVTLPEDVIQLGNSAFDGCLNLTDVYYGGTKEQWRSIKRGGYNYYLLNATIHYNS